jgi:hypothetical protein
MMTTDELIAALERAEGPSHELDCAIAVVSGQYVREKRGRDRQEWFYATFTSHYRKSTSAYSGYDRIPCFTSSIDAARTLVPEGCWADIDCEPGDVVASIFTRIEDPPHGWLKDRVAHVEGKTTPALALCLAALRARSQP